MVSTSQRERPARGCTIWFTGLSGAGKTTVCQLVAEHLRAQGHAVETLDGDAVRQTICRGLGFTRADRDENVRRIGWVCELLNRHGVFACAAAISPYDATRQEIRSRIGDFVLVHCRAPLEVLEQRDKNRLYSRVRAGEIEHVSGVDDPYEEPADADVVVSSDGSETPADSAGKVIAALERLGHLPSGVER
jgi:adenylylsulfate kinase